jgi:hypothetical protein
MPTNRSLFWADTEDALDRALSRAGRGPAAPAAVPEVPARPRATATPQPPATASEFRPPATGSLEDRIEAWRQWLAGADDPTHAFLLDKDGLPLLPRDADGQLVDLASCARGLLGRLAESTSAAGTTDIALRLPDERVLHLLELPTPLGPLTVGLVRHDPGAAGFAARFRESLERCFATDAA